MLLICNDCVLHWLSQQLVILWKETTSKNFQNLQAQGLIIKVNKLQWEISGCRGGRRPSGRLRTRSGRAGWHQPFQPQKQMLTGLIIYKVTPENRFVFNKHLKLEEEWFLIQDSYAINTSQKPGLQDNKNMPRHIQAKKPNHELLICFRKETRKYNPAH